MKSSEKNTYLYSTTFLNQSWQSIKSIGNHTKNILKILPLAVLDTTIMIGVDYLAKNLISWLNTQENLKLSNYVPILENIPDQLELSYTNDTIIEYSCRKIINFWCWATGNLFNGIGKAIILIGISDVAEAIPAIDTPYKNLEFKGIFMGLGPMNLLTKLGNFGKISIAIPLSFIHTLTNGNILAEVVVPKIYNHAISLVMQKSLYDHYMSLMLEGIELIHDVSHAIEDATLGLTFKALETIHGEHHYMFTEDLFENYEKLIKEEIEISGDNQIFMEEQVA